MLDMFSRRVLGIVRGIAQAAAKLLMFSSTSWEPNLQFPLPILDTLQKMTNSFLVNVDIPINTKRLED